MSESIRKPGSMSLSRSKARMSLGLRYIILLTNDTSKRRLVSKKSLVKNQGMVPVPKRLMKHGKRLERNEKRVGKYENKARKYTKGSETRHSSTYKANSRTKKNAENRREDPKMNFTILLSQDLLEVENPL